MDGAVSLLTMYQWHDASADEDSHWLLSQLWIVAVDSIAQTIAVAWLRSPGCI